MEKNWLIRTKTNHILGPISKEKVIELITNKSLKPEDELCSANGYWFYVKEKNLLDKYIFGRELQSFNPVSEARDVVSLDSMDELAPRQPSVTSISNDTMVSKDVNLDLFKPNLVGPKKKVNNTMASTSGARINYKDSKNLHYVLISLFVVLVSLIYFRKIIFKEISLNLSNPFMSTALAQDDVKKKLFLSP